MGTEYGKIIKAISLFFTGFFAAILCVFRKRHCDKGNTMESIKGSIDELKQLEYSKTNLNNRNAERLEQIREFEQIDAKTIGAITNLIEEIESRNNVHKN